MTDKRPQHAAIGLIIGRNIRRRRLLLRLSQKEVAGLLDVTSSQVRRYERNAESLSCDRLVQWATILGCRVDDLCQGAVDDSADSSPQQPWNPYRVHTLVRDFNRIRSPTVRNRVCGLVRDIADLVSAHTAATP